MKKCSICKLEKEDVGKNGKCKSCNTEYMRQYRLNNQAKIKKYQQEYDANYYQENKEQILDNKKEYYQDNKEYILEDRVAYYQDNKKDKQKYNKDYYQNNKEHLIKNAKTYAAKNTEWLREYHNEYYKERRVNDINFRIKTNISANINIYLKSNGSSKNNQSTLKYLPYSIDELKEYIENQFEFWMTWNNYGRYDVINWDDNNSNTWSWQLDHIIPHSTFSYTSMEDQSFKECWSLKNLRPLSAKQNFMDGVKRTRHI